MIRRKRGIFSVFNVRLTCLLPFFLTFAGLSYGQVPMGARLSGLAGAVTAIPNDPWQVFGNPAMVPTDAPKFSLFTRRNYNLSELTDYAGSVTWSRPKLTLGVGANTYGNSLFRQTRFLVVGMRRFHAFRIGVRLTYTRISIAPPYGAAGQFGFDLGIGVQALTHLWIGASATNINHPKLGKSHEALPQTLDLGLAWFPVNHALIAISVHKDIRFPVSVRSGIEWQLVPAFSMRVGITTKPTTYDVGAGINPSNLSINIVAQHHQWLGWSPGIDVGLNL